MRESCFSLECLWNVQGFSELQGEEKQDSHVSLVSCVSTALNRTQSNLHTTIDEIFIETRNWTGGIN